tara:strand:- start:128 stop:538 length:411 start_codon:yes stop_codon:yes gene_type:complete
VENMIVEMFSISQGYGFCSNPELKVFFRVEDFLKHDIQDPQPILGEKVIVSSIKHSNSTPKAFKVERVDKPIKLKAKVTSFDSNKGWGFAKSEKEVFFIHKSDFVQPFIPIIGSSVYFYPGIKKGKNRACYVAEKE